MSNLLSNKNRQEKLLDKAIRYLMENESSFLKKDGEYFVSLGYGSLRMIVKDGKIVKIAKGVI